MSSRGPEKEKFDASVVIKTLEELHNEYFELYPSNEVPILENIPTSLEFLRNYVSQNRPVLIKNAVTHSPAFKYWTNDYLRSKLHNKKITVAVTPSRYVSTIHNNDFLKPEERKLSYAEMLKNIENPKSTLIDLSKLHNDKITVAVTPNGYADAIYNNDFLLPEERKMKFQDFLETLENPKSPVFYIQKQDNNFPEEFNSLLEDIDQDFPWATEAFGRKPEAVNFWMGDGRAISSLHKDHYENIYCVIRGKKDFILHAPVDAPWIPYVLCKVGRYYDVDETGSVHFRPLNKKVNWIVADPLKDYESFHFYSKAQKYFVTVEEGDALYLPSLWFHHVRQSHGCIAVNYWYDMDYNHNYAHFKYLEKMGEVIHGYW